VARLRLVTEKPAREQVKNPQLTVEVDHDKAYALGLTPAQVSDALYSAYGTRQISTIYTPNNEYYVIIELLPEFQDNPDKLSFSTSVPAEGSWFNSTLSQNWYLPWVPDGESPGPVAGRNHQLQP
jgi:multidrug efflux pump subunit AcrB